MYLLSSSALILPPSYSDPDMWFLFHPHISVSLHAVYDSSSLVMAYLQAITAHYSFHTVLQFSPDKPLHTQALFHIFSFSSYNPVFLHMDQPHPWSQTPCNSYAFPAHLLLSSTDYDNGKPADNTVLPALISPVYFLLLQYHGTMYLSQVSQSLETVS